MKAFQFGPALAKSLTKTLVPLALVISLVLFLLRDQGVTINVCEHPNMSSEYLTSINRLESASELTALQVMQLRSKLKMSEGGKGVDYSKVRVPKAIRPRFDKCLDIVKPRHAEFQVVHSRTCGLWAAVKNADDIVSEAIENQGGWESHIVSMAVKATDFEGKAMSPVPVAFIDIGANLGWFSLNVAKHGYDVVAIEAMPSNYDMLRMSACLNDLKGNLRVYNIGVGEKRESCRVYTQDSNLANGNVLCDGTLPDKITHEGFDMKFRENVEVFTLDEVLHLVQPNKGVRNMPVVKIDVEHLEIKVFSQAGAGQLMSDNHPHWYSPRVIFSEVYENKCKDGYLKYMVEELGYGVTLKTGFQPPAIRKTYTSEAEVCGGRPVHDLVFHKYKEEDLDAYSRGGEVR